MVEAANDKPLVSVVMPCLNEEQALPACIEKIKRAFSDHNINGEIVVSDNGSTDRSVEIAEAMGARVVHQPQRGYGNAYFKGFAEARGQYLIMGDADDTYDFSLIPHFLSKLQDEGFDFVTGSRYATGGDEHITFLHRYIGNPALTAILNCLFKTNYTDVYCGFRGFSNEAYQRIKPLSPGMEFNLELAINAHLAQFRIAEIPIRLGPRKGVSKLHTIKDGWRSLRMMLLYCPNKTFLLPGLTLFFTGAMIHLVVLLHLIHYHGREPSTVAGLLGTISCVVGFQILSLGLHAKTYSWSRRFDRDNANLLRFYKLFNLEAGLVIGLGSIAAGTAIILLFIYRWLNNDLLPLHRPEWIPLAATFIIIGFNIVFSSLFISAMSLTKESS